MFNVNKVIKEINKSCKNFFTESTFDLRLDRNNRFVIAGVSKAINNYKNTQNEVDVIKWFDDFWLYIDISFEKSENSIPNAFISLSVFQGDYADNTKNQLFRAEWDNFDNNDIHPQPHWHIYSNHSFESFNEFVQKNDEDDGFVNIINEEKSKAIDLKKMHFAMNGNWDTNGSHIHKIRDENTIINWFPGLLGHIKSQLEYVK